MDNDELIRQILSRFKNDRNNPENYTNVVGIDSPVYVPSQEEIEYSSNNVSPLKNVEWGADGLPIIPSNPIPSALPTPTNVPPPVLANSARQNISPAQTANQASVPENLGKTIADVATVRGLLGSSDLQRQMPLDSVAKNQFVPFLIEAKKLYSNANNPVYQNALGMSADEIKARANKSAESMRQLGAAMGLDLSGYTSDTTIEDAYQNLQTEKARALMDFWKGQYRLTSGEFLQKRYEELVGSGLPVDRAARVAELEANEYKGERTRYLADKLYGYGFDDNGAMTHEGQLFAEQLALENPNANRFFEVNPSEKDIYAQASAIAQAMLNNGAAADRLSQSIAGNLTLADLNAQNSLNLADRNARNQYKTWYNQEKQKREWAPQDAQTLYNAKYNILKSIHGEENAKAILMAEAGLKPNSNNDKAQSENLKVVLGGWEKALDFLGKQKENLLSRYPYGQDLPDDAKNELADIDARIEVILSAIDEATGLGDANNPKVNPYSGDHDKDIATIKAMLVFAKADATRMNQEFKDEQALALITDWVYQTDKTVSIETIKKMIDEANGVVPTEKRNKSGSERWTGSQTPNPQSTNTPYSVQVGQSPYPLYRRQN